MTNDIRPISLWFDSLPDTRRYPKLTENVTADVVIIGGGIVGITAAWNLRKSGLRVVLLEKNHIGTGDTGLTTGFITRSIEASVKTLLAKYGLDFVKQYWQVMKETQRDIIRTTQEENISCDFTPCDSYHCAYQANDEVLKAEWEIMQSVDPDLNFRAAGEGETRHWAEAVQFHNEGKFHSRKYLFGLLERLKNDRFHTYEESEVIDVSVHNGVTAKTRDGSVKTKTAIIATGNPSLLFPELATLVQQHITYVIAARYADHTPMDQSLYWDTGDPYYYYRSVDEHTILVGGCDSAVDQVHTQQPFALLEEFLRAHLSGTYDITHQWSGSIFTTIDGVPFIFSHPHYGGKIVVGAGWGGSGIVGGSLAAKLLADFVTGAKNSYHQLFSLERTKTVIEKPQAKREPTVKGFTPFASVAEFAAGKPVCRVVGGKKIFAVRIEKDYYAMDNTCSHAGGSLGDGTVEGSTIQCPLHGAKFDITSGKVMAPPAVRPQQTYPIKIEGQNVLISLDVGRIAQETTPQKRKTYWKQMFLFSSFVIVFWLLQFSYQYFLLLDRLFELSLIRSFAIGGATLISLALFSSAVFKWVPKLAVHWRIRRYFGVSGFVLIVFHVLSVYAYIYQWDIFSVYYTWNPLENPILFGSIAFPIFMVMALTSTDWAVEKLGARRWKNIHRLVYFGYAAAVAHLLLMNPSALYNFPGYILLLLVASTLVGQLYWFIAITSKRPFATRATLVGLIIISIYLVLGYLAFFDGR